jgi:thymidylate synthase (FAD)
MIKTYDDIAVQVLRCTESPAKLICDAASQTMHQHIEECPNMYTLVKFLLNSEHHSVFEHASITFHLRGISRSLLAQITRHRTFKFTSSSQHYQDYREYPVVIGKDQFEKYREFYGTAFACIYEVYEELLKTGVPKEEARQVLPNAAGVNLVVTADARNLINFFRQRRCQRNVNEMIQVADAMWGHAKTWFPELFSIVGAPCFMNGKCNQGHMQAESCKNAG